MKNNKKNHILMLVLLVIWTVDAVAVSSAVDSMSPIFILCVKTAFSLPVLALTAILLRQSLRLPEKKDIPKFIICAILGDILYYFFEYSAYEYLPIGMTTVILGMCPLFSYIVDCIVQRKRPEIKILILISISIFGLGIAVLDGDTDASPMGYIFCTLAIATWILYGYAVNTIGKSYELIPLTFYEELISIVIMLPFAIFFRPQVMPELTTIINIAVMGILMNGFGYILENNSLLTLGTTISGLYINMLPVFTATAGFLLLGENLSIRQIIGCAIVVICGFAVIILNGKSKAKEPSNIG